jgi:hypothetical protein
LNFGEMLANLIEKRGHTQRGYAKTIGMDGANLNKVINNRLNAPRSPHAVWGFIGLLNPTEAEVSAFMRAARDEEIESVKIKWEPACGGEGEHHK